MTHASRTLAGRILALVAGLVLVLLPLVSVGHHASVDKDGIRVSDDCGCRHIYQTSCAIGNARLRFGLPLACHAISGERESEDDRPAHDSATCPLCRILATLADSVLPPAPSPCMNHQDVTPMVERAVVPVRYASAFDIRIVRAPPLA